MDTFIFVSIDLHTYIHIHEHTHTRTHIYYIYIYIYKYISIYLLPTGSEEREVLGVGVIPVAILPSRQDMKTVALLLNKHKY